MISGIFGDLQLAEISITELRKQKNLNIEQPQKQQSRQSQIFSQNNFHIEIKRPNFDSIQLNHPLLQLDLNDIQNSKFFEINDEKFNELMKNNLQYLDKYYLNQDYKVDLENRVSQTQIAQMNFQIKNNNQPMIPNDTNVRKIRANQQLNQQNQNSPLYPFLGNQSSDNDKTISEKDYNDIITYFRQKNNEISRDSVKFYIEAYDTKDPMLLFEFIKNEK
ncbi:unnamed protein product [Paramecium sonneborni]|uniref:Uncharacterized protein n=1 Tax=Paramecium sonneborni TaxID=65129 RepID=A0A8S1M3U5_9CILI|nr:unnamed protein product [Paramecium sonneborni]